MHENIKSLIAAFVLTGLVTGCASNKPAPEPRTELQSATDRLEAQSQALLREQEEIRRRFQNIQPTPPIAPVQPTYDPLEGVRVTLDVEDASVHHVLRALANQVNMDLVVHPNLVEVPNRISVHFTNADASRVFREVLRISDVAGTVDNGMLIVNPMEERVFHLDFMESTTTMNLSAGGDVLGASQGASGTGGAAVVTNNALAGNFRIDGSSAQNVNPYDALEDMLSRLIGSQAPILSSGVDAASSVEEVSALATVETARRSDTPVYSLNRITGTLYVRTKPSVMNTISNLIDRYREVLSRQILIEAQVLEITLSDSFSYGVDWSFLQDRVASGFGATGAEIGGVESTSPNLTQNAGRSVTIPGRTLEALGDSFLGLSYFGDEFSLSIDLLQKFGDVMVLSNPTLRTKHGQPALISVGRSSTFVSETGSTVVPSGVGSTITQDVQTSSVFDGLMVGLQPFIADDGQISMIVHPIQSNVDEESLVLVDVGGQSRISLPQVDLKELSTTIRLRDGDLIMLGGLIDSDRSKADDNVPGISRIPIFGKLFESTNKRKATRELVIVLKVTEV